MVEGNLDFSSNDASEKLEYLSLVEESGMADTFFL
jgi:hypothetical protein